MGLEKNNLCCGCLTTDRKMLHIEDAYRKQYFFAIINDVPISQNQTLWLCWECEASISRCLKFKKQVSLAYAIFQKYLNKNINLEKIQSHTNLGYYAVKSITIDENSTEVCDTIFDVKVESEKSIQPETQIKEENLYENSDRNSDDDPLFVVKKKRKRKKREFKFYKELELTREEIEAERRVLSLNDDYINAMFRCERCIESFPNEDDMRDHIMNKHELNSSHLKCKICECSFNSEMSYTYHTNKHIKRCQCMTCGLRFSTKRSVTKHYNSIHYSGFDIAFEKQEPNGRSELAEDSDSTKYQITEQFPCEFCEKTFRWKTSLRKHIETHRIQSGQKRRPYCEPCRLSFTTSSNLRKHVKTSSKHQIQLKLRKLRESQDMTNPDKDQLRIDEIKCSVNKSREQYACQQCNKRFQWRGNLLRHLHSHEARANGELVCKPCNRTFSSVATYKQHLKISKKHVSENEFKYMCNDCGKRFANKTRLKDHIDWEHLKKFTHTCPLCQKVFKSHTSLYLHKQVVHKKGHSEHLCDHCGKPFPNHAKLRSHMRALHSPESAYKCETCSARFSWHSCLSRHVRRVHKTTGSKQN